MTQRKEETWFSFCSDALIRTDHLNILRRYCASLCVNIHFGESWKTKIKVATYFSWISRLVVLIRLGWRSQKDCIANPQGTLVISWMGCRHSPAEFDLGSTCSFGLSHMKLYQRIIYSCIYMEMFSTFSDFSLPWDSEVWVLELVNGDDSII